MNNEHTVGRIEQLTDKPSPPQRDWKEINAQPSIGDTTSEWEKRFDELQLGKFVDGLHVPCTKDDYHNFIRSLLASARAETAKAYGGCTNCYGKGYNTVIQNAQSYEDFGGEKTSRWELSRVRPCTHCERGTEIEKIQAEGKQDGAREACDYIWKNAPSSDISQDGLEALINEARASAGADKK